MAAFSDESWTHPLALTNDELNGVLQAMRVLGRMAARGGDVPTAAVVEILLETKKLLLPSQGKAICEQLGSRDAIKQEVMNLPISCVVASFLTDPSRWCTIDFGQRHAYWSDHMDGCAWAQCVHYERGRWHGSSGNGAAVTKPTYRALLASHVKAEAEDAALQATLAASGGQPTTSEQEEALVRLAMRASLPAFNPNSAHWLFPAYTSGQVDWLAAESVRAKATWE